MNALKTAAIVLGIAVSSLFVSPAEALAAKNTHAMVAVKNPTNIKINYYFRWGKDAEWKSYSIEAGNWRWHSWEYDYPNENKSPIPQIKFDEDLSDELEWRIYDLKAFASPDQEIEHAKKYKFIRKAKGQLLDLATMED